MADHRFLHPLQITGIIDVPHEIDVRGVDADPVIKCGRMFHKPHIGTRTPDRHLSRASRANSYSATFAAPGGTIPPSATTRAPGLTHSAFPCAVATTSRAPSSCPPPPLPPRPAG